MIRYFEVLRSALMTTGMWYLVMNFASIVLNNPELSSIIVSRMGMIVFPLTGITFLIIDVVREFELEITWKIRSLTRRIRR